MLLGTFIRDKDIPVPKIVLCRSMPRTNERAAAAYYQPWPNEECFDGRFVTNTFGIIALAEHHYDEEFTFEASLAHEYRHHWQRFNCQGDYNPPVIRGAKDYQEEICQYFSTSFREWDALQFEIRHSPNDVNRNRNEYVRRYVTQRRKALQLPGLIR